MKRSPVPTAALEKPLQPPAPIYSLQLYVVGTTPASSRAVVNVRRLCEEHLAGKYKLDVVDLSINPELAASAQIIAAPTLIKRTPLPTRRFIGDMSNADRVLIGLGVALSATTSPGSDLN